MPERNSAEPEFIPSLEKGLAVIELFGADAPALTLSQIASKLQLTPGSANRVVRTLEMLGYLTCEENRFSLTTRVLQLGFAYLSSQPMAKVLQPVLMEIAIELHANCSVAVLDESDVIYVARATYRYTARERDYVALGSRFPAYATSPGKVFLAALSDSEVRRRIKDISLEKFTPNTVDSLKSLKAELAEVREQGYAINDQQTFMGLRSIAIPLQIEERTIAALVAASRVGQVTVPGMISGYLPVLRDAANRLAQMSAVLT